MLAHAPEQLERSAGANFTHPDVAGCEPRRREELVESSVAYATQFWLRATSCLRKTLSLWNGIDSSECSTEFEFGRDGKPHFISGPYDTAITIAASIAKLQESVGEGNYDFTINEGGGMEDGLMDHSDEYSPLIDDRELDVDIDQDVPQIGMRP